MNARCRRALRHTGTVASPALVLVGTPIGNLGDLSTRGREALAGADVIACEDTRRTGGLLSHLGIVAPRMIVVNEHTEAARADEIVAMVRSGKRVVLCSDAGMPGISDPGERVVRSMLHAGLPVEVVPGPSAVSTALVLSGFATGRYVFEGFLARKGVARSEALQRIGSETRTLVLYEAPHRVVRTLVDLRDVCDGNRRVALARELTKMHEDVWRGTLDDAVAHGESQEPRGEFVIVLEGAPPPPAATDDVILAAIAQARARGLSTRDAVVEVADVLNVAKRHVYQLAHQ